MSGRHLSRAIVLQTLFEWDFNDVDKDTNTILKRNIEDFSPGGGDFSFMNFLVKGVLDKQNDLDTIIKKAAPQWPLENISMIDRNVLRIGLYELLFGNRNEVPAKVAINEAIELAKSFGGDKSGKFVNGVLGAVYKEIGKPGFEEMSNKKTATGSRLKNISLENLDPLEEAYREGGRKADEKIPVERLAGAVIYSKNSEGATNLAFVHDVFGYWTLSKGHLEEGENDKDGVKRIVKNKIGLEVHPEYYIGKNEYISRHPEKKKIKKQVNYYLASASYEDLSVENEGGLDDARWFNLSKILALNLYNDVLPIITKAVNHIVGEKSGDKKQ